VMNVIESWIYVIMKYFPWPIIFQDFLKFASYKNIAVQYLCTFIRACHKLHKVGHKDEALFNCSSLCICFLRKYSKYVIFSV
jgi:hypothetical protein